MKSGKNNNKFIMFDFDMELDAGSTTLNYKGVRYGKPIIVDIADKNSVKSTFL